jgi:hypothetical protein
MCTRMTHLTPHMFYGVNLSAVISALSLDSINIVCMKFLAMHEQ